MTTGCPQFLVSPWPSARAVTSVTPPAAAVTIIVIGRRGYDALWAKAAPHSNGTTSSVRHHPVIGRSPAVVLVARIARVGQEPSRGRGAEGKARQTGGSRGSSRNRRAGRRA